MHSLKTRHEVAGKGLKLGFLFTTSICLIKLLTKEESPFHSRVCRLVKGFRSCAGPLGFQGTLLSRIKQTEGVSTATAASIMILPVLALAAVQSP
jgi:hypothetical protein